MFIQPCADGLTASHRAPLFSSGFRFFPSYFRVVGRCYEFTFTMTYDLSLTIDVVGVELTSFDMDPKMAFGVAHHGFSAGYATPGLHAVAPGLLRFFFFCLFFHFFLWVFWAL